MLSSTQLKEIAAEARPILERRLDDAELLAGLRDMVSANGGDWSALKALITAQIKDERDESGERKHVRKILDKAEFSSGYADMLGWSNMNEQNFSSGEVHDEPATETQHSPAAQSLPVLGRVNAEPDGRSGDESPVTHSPETAERGAGPETAPATDDDAVPPAVSSSTPIIPFHTEETREQRTLRLKPHCQNLSACRSAEWNKHCYLCTRLMDTGGDAA